MEGREAPHKQAGTAQKYGERSGIGTLPAGIRPPGRDYFYSSLFSPAAAIGSAFTLSVAKPLTMFSSLFFEAS